MPAKGKFRTTALGYAREPGVDAQRRAIRRGCRARGLELVAVVSEDDAGSESRAGLVDALRRLEDGEAECLIVSQLERLAPAVGGLAPVLDRLEQQQKGLVALDVGLDTATAEGRLALARRPGVAPEPAWDLAAELAAPAAQQPAAVEADGVAVAEAVAPAPPPVALDPPPERTGVRALGYASVPADADTDDLEAQRQVIEDCCERLGLGLVEVIREREAKGGKALERAGVAYVIERLAAGDATCLVVSGLDRLSHSAAELGTLVQWLERADVRLVAVELGLDSVSPGGQAAVRALASVGSWERERLSERTRKGLAAARAKRRAGGDASSTDWVAVRKRIAVMRADGMTLQAIADVLNEEDVPTPRGGLKWRPSSVQTAAGYRRRSRAKGVADLPAVAKPPRPGPTPPQ